MNEAKKQWNEKINVFAHETAGLNIETGKTGICLYFFMLADSLKNKKYQQWAEELLKEIYGQLDQDMSIKTIREIMQVGIGFYFLLKRKYVEGNINQVLEDVDNALFRWMSSSKPLTYEMAGFLHILYYLYLRIEKQKPNSNSLFLMEELTIKAFNDVYASLNSAFYDEPVLFYLGYKLPLFLYVLSKIHSLGFYNYRIDEVIKEIAGLIQSRIPVLHANRLYLLWSLVNLKQTTGFTFWDEQINIIYHNINVQKIVEQELRDKQVFVTDGVAGIYLLLNALEKTDYKIPFDMEMLRKRINDSDVWKENAQQPLVFSYGMSGLLWVEHLINQRINAL